MIAVAVMGVVQVTIDQIVDVVAVGHCRVTAAGTMNVICIVTGAGVGRGAGRRVDLIDAENMLVDVGVMGMVQMAVVKVVDVAVVNNRDVTAVWTVNVGVIKMLDTSHGRAPQCAFPTSISRK